MKSAISLFLRKLSDFNFLVLNIIFGFLISLTFGFSSPALAQTATCAPSDTSVPQGGQLHVGYNNFPAGGNIFIWTGSGSTIIIGTAQTGPNLATFTIPTSTPTGNYGLFISNGTTNVPCGNFNVTAGSGGSGGCANADVNGDGQVDVQDYQAVANQIGKPYNSKYDLNGDGVVDTNDLATFNSCTTVTMPPPNGSDLGQPTQFCGILNVIQNLIKFLAPAAALAFFVMLLVGGFKFVTSGGDPKSAASARSTLTYAVIGIILVVVAWLLLLLVQFLTGVNVTSVKLNC